MANDIVNSTVAHRLLRQGFEILDCDRDWEPIHVEASRNNIDVTVYSGKVYFDEHVVDKKAGTFGFREIDHVHEWKSLSDLKFDEGTLPHEIDQYNPGTLEELIAAAERQKDTVVNDGSAVVQEQAR